MIRKNSTPPFDDPTDIASTLESFVQRLKTIIDRIARALEVPIRPIDKSEIQTFRAKLSRGFGFDLHKDDDS